MVQLCFQHVHIIGKCVVNLCKKHPTIQVQITIFLYLEWKAQFWNFLRCAYVALCPATYIMTEISSQGFGTWNPPMTVSDTDVKEQKLTVCPVIPGRVLHKSIDLWLLKDIQYRRTDLMLTSSRSSRACSITNSQYHRKILFNAEQWNRIESS